MPTSSWVIPIYSQKLSVLVRTCAVGNMVIEGSYSNNKECRVGEDSLSSRLWKERGEEGYLEHVGTRQRL